MSRPVKARLFIALELPSSLRRDLADWTRAAVGATLRSGLARALGPESMHLTLRFLGSRPVHEIDALARLVEEHAPPTEALTLGAPLWLPARRPRVLAVEVHDPSEALLELHRDLSLALATRGLDPDAPASPAGRPVPSGRAFRPHITVARLRAGGAPRDRVLPVTPRRAFTSPRLVLFRSHLDRAGARYEALAEGLPVEAVTPG